MPLDPVPIIANLTIRGWTAGGEEKHQPLVFRVEWTSGYTKPLAVDFNSGQFSESKWESLTSLDFAVDYGPDQLDWEFCFDDLAIGLIKCDPNPLRASGKQCGRRRAEGVEWEDL